MRCGRNFFSVALVLILDASATMLPAALQYAAPAHAPLHAAAPAPPRPPPGGAGGLAGDVEDALRALLPMLRERSDRTFLRPPAENLRRLVRRHYRRARGHGHEQSETPQRTGLPGAPRLLNRPGGFDRPVGVENSVKMVCFVLEDYGRESVDRLRFFGEPLVAVAQYDPLRPHHPAR